MLKEDAASLVRVFDVQFELDYSRESLRRLELLVLEAKYFVPPPFVKNIIKQCEAYALIVARKLLGGEFKITVDVPSLVVMTKENTKAETLVIRERIKNVLAGESESLELAEWLAPFDSVGHFS